MRTKTIKLYQYDELSDRAKEKARDWYREASTGDTWFADHVITEFETIADYCGWLIAQRPVLMTNGKTRYEPAVFWSLGYSQGDGACFEGSFRADHVNANKLREYAPKDTELHRIVDELAKLAARFPLATASVKPAGCSHDVEFDTDIPRPEGIAYKSAGWESFSAESWNMEKALMAATRDLMRWCYNAIRAENDYQMADEQVEDHIRANEYEFLESGECA